MYHIHLSASELKKINHLQNNEHSVRVHRRLQALKLANQGHTHKEISKILNVCVDTITDWIKLYEAEGLSGIGTLQFTGKKQSKIDAYIETIKQDIKDNTISTLAELQDWIKTKYSLELEQSWLWRCCKKNSICLTKRLG